jgi:F-type H+-transporting ATPase subunit gamma
MSDSLESLRRKIVGAGDLESVVRSMKALAASSIGQYERSVLALNDYYRTVELGLIVCLRERTEAIAEQAESTGHTAKRVSAVVFGSDQGLVGQFNDVLSDFVAKALAALPGEKNVWAVGDRIHSRLVDAGLPPVGFFAVPTSVNAITPLVGEILAEIESHHSQGEIGELRGNLETQFTTENRRLPLKLKIQVAKRI